MASAYHPVWRGDSPESSRRARRARRRTQDVRAARRNRRTYARYVLGDAWDLPCDWTSSLEVVRCRYPYVRESWAGRLPYCLTHDWFADSHPKTELGYYAKGVPSSPRWWSCDCAEVPDVSARTLRRVISEGYWEWVDHRDTFRLLEGASAEDGCSDDSNPALDLSDLEEFGGLWPLQPSFGSGPDIGVLSSHYWCW